VFIGGELWQARRGDGLPLVPGELMEVQAIGDGLELVVKPTATEAERVPK
jgi:membrane protein implicated in regulation of membrane protease activity